MSEKETPEQVARRAAREIRDALRRAGRDYLRYGETIDGLRLTIGVKQAGKVDAESFDLPDELRVSRPSTRRVYRVLRELVGANQVVRPSVIEAHLREMDTESEPSLHTINHALRDLRDRGLAWSHSERGWCLGREQETLPFFTGPSEATLQTASLPAPQNSPKRASRGASTVTKNVIWVPGEQSDYGVVITDAVTEGAVAVTERVGEMQVTTRSGRLRKVPAVRGELLRTEEPYALVRLPGGHQIRTRILGEWHTAGMATPESDTPPDSGAA